MSGRQTDDLDAAGPVDATQLERVLTARARLLKVLEDIAGQAASQSLVRCPYRTRDDTCTLRGPCRNLRVQPHGLRQCAGGTLNPASPDAAELDAVFADVAPAAGVDGTTGVDTMEPDEDVEHRNPGTAS
jgi:hypothetical protein